MQHPSVAACIMQAVHLVLPLLLLLLLLHPSAASIPGPQSVRSSIGIVGAGPAGMHMAYMLHSLGFQRITVLEASDRVGGRSVSIRDAGGVVHEMGTCYVSSDYDHVRRLSKWTGSPLREVLLPEATMTKKDGSVVPSRSFISKRVCQLLKVNCGNPSNIRRLLLDAATRYARLHAELFSFADGFSADAEFPPKRPSSSRLNSSIGDFLRQNRLLALEPLFLLGMTTMGYGSLEDTSLIYALMWMTPAYINDLLVNRPDSRLGLLTDGFEDLWRRVHRRLASSVAVKFNARIAAVHRRSDSVSVVLQDGNRHSFDWLVWTPDLSLTHKLFSDLSDNERRIFGQLQPRQFITKVLKFPNGSPMNVPVTYFEDNLLRLLPDPAMPWAARDSARALNTTEGRDSKLVAYFLSNHYSPGSDVNRLPAPWSDAEVQHSFNFNFMTRFSIKAIGSGVLWDIIEQLQGQRRVWFAGHSVVFDSVKSVIKYNKMLLNLAYPHLRDKAANL